MQDYNLAGREKAALSVRIANRERQVLKGIDYQDGYSTVCREVPFCPQHLPVPAFPLLLTRCQNGKNGWKNIWMLFSGNWRMRGAGSGTGS